MSELCLSMGLIIDTFEKYSKKEGDKQTLTRGELSELLHDQMPIAECKCQHEVCEFFQKLDQDKDGVVDFQEFMALVSVLTIICKGK
ncbi:ictacalcin-like [Cheilinus undulatus]|uniref:ictacalcin-like n=1 Tax=Cheilinus undulatus TaxID=241271 RepID=UPI001BD2FA03|nr:ictacalcin-like [Cheilinus undulatus]